VVLHSRVVLHDKIFLSPRRSGGNIRRPSVSFGKKERERFIHSLCDVVSRKLTHEFVEGWFFGCFARALLRANRDLPRTFSSQRCGPNE
jgi:hypothetical protein